MVNVSVVITVKNEEDSILQLLNSLENQSLKPYEVIIVDGGSKDRTVEIINSFIASKNSFKLILADGANRPKGRNIGISAATSDVIAITDAGVVLDRHWLENLVKPLVQEGADFVGGVYVQDGESLLQKCIGILQYPNIEKLHVDDFIPSCRSVVFKKDVWKSVGYWPERLEKADDTYFDLMVREKGFKIALAKDAVVSWTAKNTLKGLFQQYSSYAEWDVRAGLFSKLKIYRLMVLAYFILAFLLFLIFEFGFWGFLFSFLVVLSYLFFSGVKAFAKTRKLASIFLGVAVKITIFSAETHGLVKGLIARVSKK
jgi:glycosyltransferase involved in cell wall biosynthesis